MHYYHTIYYTNACDLLFLQLFKTWCEAISRPELLEKDAAAVRKFFWVCDIHFENECKFIANHNRTNLKSGSIPTINLPSMY